jgi:uncharacterized membrane protein YphA (DoxX/SURF4 family)
LIASGDSRPGDSAVGAKNSVAHDDHKSNDGDDCGDERGVQTTGRLTLSRILGARAHVVPLFVRLALGGLFVTAGALKIGHPADLAAAITAYRLGLPPPLVAALALALPPFEILLGIYLIGGLLLPVSSAVALGLLAFFTVAVASVVARGLSAPCGCFGPADSAPATWLTVLRDLAFVIPAAYLFWWTRARALTKSPASSPSR